jgi:hypothetical protein
MSYRVTPTLSDDRVHEIVAVVGPTDIAAGVPGADGAVVSGAAVVVTEPAADGVWFPAAS